MLKVYRTDVQTNFSIRGRIDLTFNIRKDLYLFAISITGPKLRKNSISGFVEVGIWWEPRLGL